MIFFGKPAQLVWKGWLIFFHETWIKLIYWGDNLGDWLGRGSRSSQPPLLLLTPSIDNGFAVPSRNRDEGRGGESIQGCSSIRQWFRAKLTITEPQMEPQRGRISFSVARSAGDFRSPRGFEVIRTWGLFQGFYGSGSENKTCWDGRLEHFMVSI